MTDHLMFEGEDLDAPVKSITELDLHDESDLGRVWRKLNEALDTINQLTERVKQLEGRYGRHVHYFDPKNEATGPALPYHKNLPPTPSAMEKDQ